MTSKVHSYIFAFLYVKVQEVYCGSKHGVFGLSSEVQKWNSSLTTGCSSLVRVRCYRVPLEVWVEETFAKLLGSLGVVVQVDEETTSSRVEYARVLVKTTLPSPLSNYSTAKINN
ncbi:hypothetical protein Fmac_006052 [Flemingia macrophylla]|uniref:DUF4283 domain-containing protein n=1 Tax=Flemingia macrophylla TaxID=520843 RepID=A0ABD1N9H8_9FABA